jgi:hypothetical protein
MKPLSMLYTPEVQQRVVARSTVLDRMSVSPIGTSQLSFEFYFNCSVTARDDWGTQMVSPGNSITLCFDVVMQDIHPLDIHDSLRNGASSIYTWWATIWGIHDSLRGYIQRCIPEDLNPVVHPQLIRDIDYGQFLSSYDGKVWKRTLPEEKRQIDFAAKRLLRASLKVTDTLQYPEGTRRKLRT